MGPFGRRPGRVRAAHNIGIDKDGRVFICDRENSRIQIFTPGGDFIEEWNDVLNPGDVYMSPDDLVYVAEQGSPTGVSIFTLGGELISRWRGSPTASSRRRTASGAASNGDVYVAEIGAAGHGQRVRKFARLR